LERMAKSLLRFASQPLFDNVPLVSPLAYHYSGFVGLAEATFAVFGSSRVLVLLNRQHNLIHAVNHDGRHGLIVLNSKLVFLTEKGGL
jgi:hypothetical protein